MLVVKVVKDEIDKITYIIWIKRFYFLHIIYNSLLIIFILYLFFHTHTFVWVSSLPLSFLVCLLSLFFLECTRRRTNLTLPILLFVVFSSGQWFSEIFPEWPTHAQNGGESGSGKSLPTLLRTLSCDILLLVYTLSLLL